MINISSKRDQRKSTSNDFAIIQHHNFRCSLVIIAPLFFVDACVRACVRECVRYTIVLSTQTHLLLFCMFLHYMRIIYIQYHTYNHLLLILSSSSSLSFVIMCINCVSIHECHQLFIFIYIGVETPRNGSQISDDISQLDLDAWCSHFICLVRRRKNVGLSSLYSKHPSMVHTVCVCSHCTLIASVTPGYGWNFLYFRAIHSSNLFSGITRKTYTSLVEYATTHLNRYIKPIPWFIHVVRKL